MRARPKARGFTSIKTGGSHDKKGLDPRQDLGKLMRKHRNIEDTLYGYVSSSGLVYEDMDFTIEEFSDMTGASLSELLADLERAMKAR